MWFKGHEQNEEEEGRQTRKTDEEQTGSMSSCLEGGTFPHRQQSSYLKLSFNEAVWRIKTNYDVDALVCYAAYFTPRRTVYQQMKNAWTGASIH